MLKVYFFSPAVIEDNFSHTDFPECTLIPKPYEMGVFNQIMLLIAIFAYVFSW